MCRTIYYKQPGLFNRTIPILSGWLITVSIIILSVADSQAQSYSIQKDLLQGHWMFYSLDAVINQDMRVKTDTHNPWNIHFTIKGDTCTLIRLMQITPEADYLNDTAAYLIKPEGNRLMFFSLKKPGKKPVHTLHIVALKNQTLTLEDPDAAKVNQTLFLRDAQFNYTFARYQSYDPDMKTPQRELTGKWYGGNDFIWDALHDKDSLKLSSVPKYYDRYLSPNGKFTDTVLRYKVVKISDENMIYKDSTDIRPGSDTYGYGVAGDDPTWLSNKPRYYIMPQRKMVEIVTPQKNGQKDRFGNSVYEPKSSLFRYQIDHGELLLIKVHD